MNIPFENPWLRVKILDTGKHEYTTFELPKAGGVVVPFTTDGKIVLVEQFRLPLGRKTLEFPAGSFEKTDGTHIKMIERELLEETGFKAKKIELLAAVNILPAMTPSVSHLFKATGCIKIKEQNLDAGEEGMEVRILTIKEVEDAIKKGTINGVEHIAAWKLATS